MDKSHNTREELINEIARLNQKISDLENYKTQQKHNI